MAPGRAPISDFTTRQLRDAFGCFATGVTVVTTVDPHGRPVGLTANSFTSVSLEPPLLLFCLDRQSLSLPAFEAAERFAVNVLHAGQEPISVRFARREGDRFAEATWSATASGVPVLRDAMVTFECRKHAVHEGGDHRIFVGAVEAIAWEESYDPLIYFQGRYRSVHVPE